jgi:host factor-I protein
MQNTTVQDKFLNDLSGKEVTVWLVNGIKLEGNLTAFDNAVLVLKESSVTQMVYQSALSGVHLRR